MKVGIPILMAVVSWLSGFIALMRGQPFEAQLWYMFAIAILVATYIAIQFYERKAE